VIVNRLQDDSDDHAQSKSQHHEIPQGGETKNKNERASGREEETDKPAAERNFVHRDSGMTVVGHKAPPLISMMAGIARGFKGLSRYGIFRLFFHFTARETLVVNKTLYVGAAAVLLLATIAAGEEKTGTPQAAKMARGKYLVENVGMCGDCHTPHNEKGEPIKEQWLKGTPLPFKPAVPIPAWADTSVNIAGLPGWEKDAAIKFFTTGIAYNDLPARPPMPQYRFNQRDAEALVLYLQSLGSQK
jgi:cytochrome c553